MATVTAFIRYKKGEDTKPVNVRFRLSDGRIGIDKITKECNDGIQLFHTSEIKVMPNQWEVKHQKLKARCIISGGESERKKFDDSVNNRKALIKSIYLEKGKSLTSEMLEMEIDKSLNPKKHEEPTQIFFDVYKEFLTKHNISDVRKKMYHVVYRVLRRYEIFKRMTKKGFTLTLDNITFDTLQNISEFLKDEHDYYDRYPELYKAFPEYHKQKPRGQNTINDRMKKIRTFFIWCVKNEKTDNNPFLKFKIEECRYGTPFYISIDERNTLYNTDLSHRPALETQRDIFVFQCLVGCRIGDFYKLTKTNVINGEIQYIARKTKDSKPATVSVPLNSIAMEILDKYADFERKTLFPFISQQKYNEAIKIAFEVAGITDRKSVV